VRQEWFRRAGHGLAVVGLLASAPLTEGLTALALLVPLAFHTVGALRPLPPRQEAGLSFLSALLVPALADPFLGVWAGLLALPTGAVALLRLPALAPPPPSPAGPGLRVTPSLLQASVALGAGWLTAGVAGASGLALASLLLTAGLAGRALYALRRLGRGPLEVEPVRLRLLAGREREVSLRLRNRTPLPLRLRLAVRPAWVRLEEAPALLPPGGVGRVRVRVAPPLAGAFPLEVWASAQEPQGLLVAGQVLPAGEVVAIARARYALWLVRRFLQEAGVGTRAGEGRGPSALVPGVAFYRLREYQPGDPARRIDWPRTYKRGEAVVREHRDPAEGPTLLLVNTEAEGPDPVDRLAFRVFTFALTLARQGFPLGLALYTGEGVVARHPPGPPALALQTLVRFAGAFRTGRPVRYLLGPPDPRLLRWARGARNGLPAGVRGLLALERGALWEGLRDHPLGQVLPWIDRVCPPPARIVVASFRNHDRDALALALPWLQARGYRVMDLMEGGR